LEPNWRAKNLHPWKEGPQHNERGKGPLTKRRRIKHLPWEIKVKEKKGPKPNRPGKTPKERELNQSYQKVRVVNPPIST